MLLDKKEELEGSNRWLRKPPKVCVFMCVCVRNTSLDCSFDLWTQEISGCAHLSLPLVSLSLEYTTTKCRPFIFLEITKKKARGLLSCLELPSIKRATAYKQIRLVASYMRMRARVGGESLNGRVHIEYTRTQIKLKRNNCNCSNVQRRNFFFIFGEKKRKRERERDNG